MKKKMDAVTKAKLIYLIELLVIAIAFLVIGILELLAILKINTVILTIFNWLTLFGGLWLIIDFVWIMVSKKRRLKASILDKSLLLPLGIYLITFDLICLIGNIDKVSQYDVYRFGVSAVLLYVFIIYTFEAIYHWFKPIPGFIEDIQKADEEDQKAAAKKLENKEVAPEENKQEENKE